jgi:CheY-like chemotaxis protein
MESQTEYLTFNLPERVADDESLRTFIRKILEEARFQVSEAANGNEGLRAFRGQGADVLLCDLFTPETDGLEVIGQLRREAPGVPIVAMSGGDWDGRLDQRRIAKLLGAVKILAKPFDRATVVEAGAEALRSGVTATPS